MSNFYSVLGRLIRPYKNILIALFIIVFFVVIGMYAYNKYYKPLKNRYRDVANTPNREEEIEIYLFSADWCPHCKKAKPDWTAFQNQYNGTTVKGFAIKCVNIDCSDESNEKSKKYILEYNVTSYPTIIALRNSERVDFDAKITKSSLDQFLNSLIDG